MQSVGDGAVVLLATSGQMYTCNSTTEVFLRHVDGGAATVPLWQRMHPAFKTEGFALRADTVTTAPRTAGGDMLLWSGGLDSTASLIEHAGSIGSLFTVWVPTFNSATAPCGGR